MNESHLTGYDMFMAVPVHRQAITFLLDSMLDDQNREGLQDHIRRLQAEPFFQSIPDAQKSLVSAFAVVRVRDALDDIFVMEALTR